MQKIKQNSNHILIIVLVIALINIGCSLSVVNQNQDTVTVKKPIDSLFTIVDTTDTKNPILITSIRLPYSTNPNNNVILVGDTAYVTTERHLHVIDVSTPDHPAYLSSLEFDHEIGKVVFYDQNLVVGTPNKIHLIDISDPSIPIVQLTKNLPNHNPINGFDAWHSYLYVMGVNDALYIFEKDQAQIKLIRTAKMSDRWKFLYPKNTSQIVEQIKYPLVSRSSDPVGLTTPLIEHRYFLQIRTNRNDSIRRASEFLGVGKLNTSSNILVVYDAAQMPVGNNPYGYRFGENYYDIHRECLRFLSTHEQTILNYGMPENTYAIINSGKMQKIDSDTSTQSIDFEDKCFLGPITDFQISGKNLYVVNAKGFLSILKIIKLEEGIHTHLYDKLLSIVPLQVSNPKSIAVSENYVCILAVLENTQQ